MPFFDTAYQGFVTGDLKQDSAVINEFMHGGHTTMVIAQSFAKIMGLYGERVGALHIVTPNIKAAESVETQVKALIRQNYSSPPAHGSRLVTTILENPDLKQKWHEDLKRVTTRITKMRYALKMSLEDIQTPGDWSHIVNQVGMFSFTGLTKEQSDRMVQKHHVYMTDDGRISVAGLTEKNVRYVAQAIKESVTNA